MHTLSRICFGVILSLFASGVAFADQKTAILRIQQLGGTVMSVAQNDPRLSVKIPAKTPDGRTVKDADLAPLADLVRAQPTDAGVIEVDLRSVEIGDQVLGYLRGLTQLESINLYRTRVTDSGLSQLSGLANLEFLNLYGTAVTDAGLKALKGLRKLHRLFLAETKVTEDGAKKFWQTMEASGNPALYLNIGSKEFGDW